MSAPLYFFPGARKGQVTADNRLVRSFLESRGLDRTFRDVGEISRDCSLFEITGTGPGGHSGVLLCALPTNGDAPDRLGYHPAQQTWEEFREFGQPEHAYWVGTDKEHPPTPADLERKTIHGGYKIKLAGHEWEVPVIRNPAGGTGLPTAWKAGAGGTVTESVRAEWSALFERFGRALWMFHGEDSPYPYAMDRTEALDLCLEAVAVNYRVGLAEQNIMGLIGSESWFPVLAATVDWPTFRDVYEQVANKKKARLAGAATSGEPGQSPASSGT